MHFNVIDGWMDECFKDIGEPNVSPSNCPRYALQVHTLTGSQCELEKHINYNYYRGLIVEVATAAQKCTSM